VFEGRQKTAPLETTRVEDTPGEGGPRTRDQNSKGAGLARPQQAGGHRADRKPTRTLQQERGQLVEKTSKVAPAENQVDPTRPWGERETRSERRDKARKNAKESRTQLSATTGYRLSNN